MRVLRFGALGVVAVSFAITLAARPATANSPWDGQVAAREACKQALVREESSGAPYLSRQLCDKAFRSGAPEDMRNNVAALMSPAGHPSLARSVVR